MLVNRSKGRKARSREDRLRYNRGPVTEIVREQDRRHVPLRAGPASRARYYQQKLKAKLDGARKIARKPPLDGAFMRSLAAQIEQNRLPDLD